VPSSNPKEKRASKERKKSESGATGGAALGGGVTYQINCAIVLALEKIAEVLAEPTEERRISIEPRTVSQNGPVTRWDFSVDEPDIVTEAKINPTRSDILEWLAHVRLGAHQNPDRCFRVIFARSTTPVLRSLERLKKIALEACGNREKMSDLVSAEQIRDADEILKILGDHSEIILPRILLESLDEPSLQREIRLTLGALVQTGESERLYEHLYTKFQTNMSIRQTFKVSDLIAEGNAIGITFRPYHRVGTDNLDARLRAVFFILQTCRAGIPVGLLAKMTEQSVENLEQSIAPYLARGTLRNDAGLLMLTFLAAPVQNQEGSTVLSFALKHMIQFIQENKGTNGERQQLINGISLAKSCERTHPEIACRLFLTLDKPLKCLGNKRLVLEVANLAIDCSRMAYPRSRDTAEAEARALICGTSWVLQRIGRLSEAQADADKSLKIATQMGWDENIAFCTKCIGRLYRMRAEASNNLDERQALLDKSATFLKEAIDRFGKLTSFGPDSAEAGDCFSLLGRTYLVARSLLKADDCVREALKRITDHSSKDYLDLCILVGDIHAARGKFSDAESAYSEALNSTSENGDATVSEITARALSRRAVARMKIDRTGVVEDFKHAFDIWTSLEEDDSAAEAAWNLILHTNPPHPEFLQTVRSEPFAVRVETERLYRDSVGNLGGGALGKRSTPVKQQIERLVRQARENVVIRHREW
jgi:tetratricopeptide (TPR) repeat protein